MAGYQAVQTGRIKKKKTIISGGVDADESPRKNQVKQMTGDFYSKSMPIKGSAGGPVSGPRGSTLTGTTTRKLGGQYRGMVSAKQQNYQKGNRVYHVWEDAQGRHVRSFVRKQKPRTLK